MKKTAMSTDAADVNVAVVRGRLRGSIELRTLPNGETVASFDVAVAVEDGPGDVVPVVVRDPSATVTKLSEGTAVIVVGCVRRRFFRAGGQTQSRTEVVAERVVRATASKQLLALRADLIETMSLL